MEMSKRTKITNIIIAVLLAVMIQTGLTSCMQDEQTMKTTITSLESEIKSLEDERAQLSSIVTQEKVDKGLVKYVLTIKIKQVHYNLDIEDHFKDAMNAITLQIPVDKEYYDGIEIGDSINESFRVGSLIMKGSFGGWKVTVINKEIL